MLPSEPAELGSGLVCGLGEPVSLGSVLMGAVGWLVMLGGAAFLELDETVVESSLGLVVVDLPTSNG